MSSRILGWLAQRVRPSTASPAPAPQEPAAVVRLSDVLRALVKSRGQLSEAELAAIGVAVARLLVVSPERHLRWTAPTQVLFARDGSVCVLFSGESPFGVADGGTVSQRWLSPELIRGEAPSAQSDLFTFASLMFVAATLRPPFEGESDWHTRAAITERTCGAPLASLRPDLSERFLSLMATAHQQGSRLFATIEAFLEAAQPIATDAPAMVARLFDVAAPMRPARPAEPDVGEAVARLVEADRLEELGLGAQARWLRRGLDGQPPLSEKELETLRKKLSLAFVASVEDSPIHGCDLALGATCPGRWRHLERTMNPLERSCGTCGALVTYAASGWDAAVAVESGRRAAVDASVPGKRAQLARLPRLASQSPEKYSREAFD